MIEPSCEPAIEEIPLQEVKKLIITPIHIIIIIIITANVKDELIRSISAYKVIHYA